MNVSEVCTASIIALIMEAVQTSDTLHGAATQKKAIFIVTAVRTRSHI
jgi:hypothetical protein